MSLDIEELKRLAEKATPGPWHWDSDPVKDDPFGRIRYQVVALGKTITKVYYSSYEGGPTNAEDDAKWIAAASPSVVLELIQRLENAEQDAKRLDWYFSFDANKGDFLATYMKGMQERWTVDQWRAAIDEAMK